MRLCELLPPTAFATYALSVCPSHPDGRSAGQDTVDRMDVDNTGGRTPATLDPMVFTSPFLLSAAHTWQDHLVSNWLGKKASDDLDKFKQGAREGTLHAEWKDETWEEDHSPDTFSRPKKYANVLERDESDPHV